VTTGRFDVVVVGVRARGDAALGDLAAAVGRATGLAPGAVQRGLEGGEVVVHQNLSKTQAVLAARTVQGLGAIVDVRPAREEGGAVAIEPDDPPARTRAPVELPPPPPAPEPAPPIPPAAPLLPPRFAALSVSSTDAKIELDLDRAGLSAPPRGTSELRASPMPSPAEPVPRPSLAPGLFAHDRVTSALLGAALAVVVGMIVAYAVARADAPGPGDIAEIRRTYFVVWAAVAIPLAVLAALLKRPSRSFR